MGRQDPDRVADIQQQLDQMHIDEVALQKAEAEEAEAMAKIAAEILRQDEEKAEREAYEQASRIYPQLKREGKVPINWRREQPPTEANHRIYDALCDMWEAREDPLESSEIDKPLSPLEIEEERAEQQYLDRFSSPDDYLDDWGGPAIPISAVRDL